MKKISDIFIEKEKTFSLEIFPPKTEKGLDNLIETIAQLCELEPDFISCTYGAGGGSREKTLDLVEHIQNTHKVPSMAHLTCVLHSKDDIKAIVKDIESRQIQNILALRGDPPIDDPDWQPTEENFKYSCELVSFIKENFNNYFSIGVAGFPEGHLLCKDLNKDSEFLKIKIDNGADFVITQFFFNNDHYFEYVKRLRKLGVTSRIIPGILPITNYEGLIKFSNLCGATISDEIKDIFQPIADDKEATIKEGINFAIKQCKELLAGGAPGLHFYSLNKLEPTRSILAAVR
ncbi:MAG: methylenetetrahydrofolate reductase [NAD(P)H] [Candidatus Omnitrophica bacterium]|nr:methylenetetrahydrofolate reductase [NAD(P)H] [Candidatus Omnitrophota bacterium]MBU1995763.1 methylenetetrahydrofolate reductase [NAD(P)H] [Candidatus Omnitrophota bacterium]MBU4334454.1 methylenetetrahydrofolate reductase [NAD(P)H] [Candidatus Omnitrophota bacterium]